MSHPRTVRYDFLQSYEDFQEQSPLIAEKQSLVEQFKEKMPDEVVQSYLNTEKEQDVTFSDYSITRNLPLSEQKKAPVFFLEPKPLGERSVSLQKWQGIVIDIGKESFSAKLINLTDRGYDEEAEFFYNKITEDDIELIKPGAVFYWAIGYNYSSKGQKRRFSDIRFRRLPVWNNKEIDIARNEAKQIRELIGWK